MMADEAMGAVGADLAVVVGSFQFFAGSAGM
jgi:hypothetical protein